MLFKKYFIYAPGNPPYELKHNDVSSTKIGFPFAFVFNAYFNLFFTLFSYRKSDVLFYCSHKIT